MGHANTPQNFKGSLLFSVVSDEISQENSLWLLSVLIQTKQNTATVRDLLLCNKMYCKEHMKSRSSTRSTFTLFSTAECLVVKVHLAPIFFLTKTNLLVIWNTSAKKFLIPINPRFSVPRRNLENNSKTPPFCCTTESEENGSSSWCDVYPGRSNISRPLISLRMMQNIYKKCAETPSRGAISCCSNIPDLKKDIL